MHIKCGIIGNQGKCHCGYLPFSLFLPPVIYIDCRPCHIIRILMLVYLPFFSLVSWSAVLRLSQSRPRYPTHGRRISALRLRHQRPQSQGLGHQCESIIHLVILISFFLFLSIMISPFGHCVFLSGAFPFCISQQPSMDIDVSSGGLPASGQRIGSRWGGASALNSNGWCAASAATAAARWMKGEKGCRWGWVEANGRSDDGLLTIKSRGCFGTRIDLHYMGARQHKGKIR